MKIAKALIALCATTLLSCAGLFAQKSSDGVDLYGKITVGWADWTVEEKDWSESFGHFEAVPTLGITNLIPLEYLDLEAFCIIGYGSEDYNSYVEMSNFLIAPGARAIYARPISSFTGKKGTWQDQLIPYAGAGLSLPIMFSEAETNYYTYDSNGNRISKKETYSDTNVYFDFDFQYGCRWAFTPQFAVLVENNFRFGGAFSYSFTAGVLYKF